LVATYTELHPDRPKDEALNADETLALFEAASQRMGEPAEAL
jgi:hypothetical protein